MEALKPYEGAFAGTLHYVVDSETGQRLRNATPLEVSLQQRIEKMKQDIVNRIPVELIPDDETSWPKILSAVSRLKTERNNLINERNGGEHEHD